MLKFLKKVLLFTLLGVSLASAQKLYFPTNVRFIAGGYINKQPYFNSLNQALNNVKPFATAANPYTFWLDGDSLFISDWDSVYNGGMTMKDSIDYYYVSTGKIKWAGFGFGGGSSGGQVIILSPTLETLHYQFPKWDPTSASPWQDSLSQAMDSIDQHIWDLIVYTGNYLYIENDTLKVDTTNLAIAMGITQNKVSAGTASFVGADTTVTVTVTGSTTSDTYILQPMYSSSTTTVNANDVLYWIPTTGGLIVKRKAGGTANLQFSYIRYKF